MYKECALARGKARHGEEALEVIFVGTKEAKKKIKERKKKAKPELNV